MEIGGGAELKELNETVSRLVGVQKNFFDLSRTISVERGDSYEQLSNLFDQILQIKSILKSSDFHLDRLEYVAESQWRQVQQIEISTLAIEKILGGVKEEPSSEETAPEELAPEEPSPEEPSSEEPSSEETNKPSAMKLLGAAGEAMKHMLGFGEKETDESASSQGVLPFTDVPSEEPSRDVLSRMDSPSEESSSEDTSIKKFAFGAENSSKKFFENIEVIREDVHQLRAFLLDEEQDEEEDKKKEKEQSLLSSFKGMFGFGNEKKEKTEKSNKKSKREKPEEPEKKSLAAGAADMFGISDLLGPLMPMLEGAISNIIMPMLKSLFGGPLGIIASIGLLINDFFKGLEFSEVLGVSKGAGIVGAIFGGDMEGGMLNAFKNAGKWAIFGATIGSFVPIVGTIIGGIIGAALGGIMGWFGAGQIAIWVEQAVNGIANWWDSTIVDLLDFTDQLADVPNKIGQLYTKVITGLVSGIMNVIGDIMTALADFEISVPDFLQKFGLPASIKPLSFLGGIAETVKGAASTVQEAGETVNAKLQEGIDERAAAKEERHAELDANIERRAKQEEAAKQKVAEAKGETPTPANVPPTEGKKLDEGSKEKERSEKEKNNTNVVNAPTTNVNTQGPTNNNIIATKPNSRAEESSYTATRNKNYAPA